MIFFTAFCAALVAFSTAAGPMDQCAAQYEEVSKNLEGFVMGFMKAMEECKESPECEGDIAPIKDCLKDVKSYKEQEKMMGMMKMKMLQGALEEIGEELANDPACDGSGPQYNDLRDVLKEKHAYHLFEGKHCKMAMMHHVMPDAACECVGQCMMTKFLADPAWADKMSVEKFDAKIKFLEDPFSQPIPDEMKEYDLMSPALCVINACGYDRVKEAVKNNPTMQNLQKFMKNMKDGLMKNPKVMKKMGEVCSCITALPGADSSFDCQSIPKLVGMKMLGGNAKREAMEQCAAYKKEMVEDMKKYFIAVGGSK